MLFADREIKEFLNGYSDFLRYAYDSLPKVQHNRMLVTAIASQITKLINENSSPKETRSNLRKLFYNGIACRSSLKNYDFSLLKDKCRSQEDYISILIAGTVHPDGYCRQKCTALLGDYPETLPYIIPQMNDWVPTVRETSDKAALSAGKKCTALTAAKSLTLLSQFRFKGRYCRTSVNELTAVLYERFSRHCTRKLLVTLTYSLNVKDKKILYGILIRNKLVSSEEAFYIANCDNDKTVRDFILLKLIGSDYFSQPRLIEFTRHKTPLVRLDSLRRLTDSGCFPCSEIERLLMDRCSAVREAAAYACKRYAGTDLREFYLSRFPKPEAVLAFAAMGTADDEKHFMPLLDSDRPKVRAAAISALCFIKGEFYDELYYTELLKNDGCAAKAAFRALKACNAQLSPKRLYNDIVNAESELLVRRLISLLCSPASPIWERMPYLLRLYNLPEISCWNSETRCRWNIVRQTVENRNIFTRISPDTAAEIRLAMKETPLPEKLVWSLEKDLENLT